MTRIAVIEDDETVSAALAYSLRRAGYEVVEYADGAVACRELVAVPPDLVVLDLGLPGIDGLDVCLRLRAAHPRLPIIILTARGEEVDRVLGLEYGGDDYVVKPFSLREMQARVKALLRRAALPSPPGDGALLRAGRFVLDRRRGVFSKDGEPIGLTPREEDLIAALMERAGSLVSREELLSRVWGPDFVGEPKTLDVHLRALRLKIEADPANPRHIVTSRGRGFRFEGDA